MRLRGFLINYQINRLSFTIILLLLFSLPVFATDWYVDKTLASSGNGQSWATAWKNFSNINWSSIQPGDIINISGGTDSTVYFETLNINDAGTTNNYITIRGAIDAGHNGKAIIDGQNTRSNCIVIEQGCGSLVRDWIYVKNLYLRRAANEAFYIHCNVNNVVIDGLDIRENGLEGINIIGNDDYYLTEGGICAEDITIKNCTIVSKANNPFHEDNCVYAQMVAGLKIHDNFIHQQNKQIGVPAGSHEHVDPLQTHVTRDVKIWNNVCIIDSSVLGHGMILGIQSRPGQLDTVIIYNNYIYAGGHLNAGGNPYINGFVLRWYGYVNCVYPLTYVINNTVVTSNGGENTILQEYAGIFYNNIICQLGTNGQNPSVYGGTALGAFASSWNLDRTYVDSVRSNLMWNEWTDDMSFGGNRFVGSGGNPIGTPSNWAEWTNSSWGGTGVNANPLFVNNVRERNGYVIASNSPAIDQGEDLQSFIESKGLPWTDIEGNPRDSSPDMGAYEYDSQIPVELTSFSATYKADKILLKWITATETNNHGFEIQRKQENSEWENIGFVEGYGTTTETNEYSFTDEDLFAGVNKFYYRLKQIDFDGSFEYSEVVELETIPTKFELSQNYPNPFNPITTINFSLPKQTQLKINIYNMLGEQVATIAEGTYEAGYHKVTFNASSLPSSAYLYRIESDAFVQVKKMILLR